MKRPLCTCADRGDPDWNGRHEDGCPWLRSRPAYDKATADRLVQRWRDELSVALSSTGTGYHLGRRDALREFAALADQLEAASAEVDRLERERERHENASKVLAGSHVAMRAEVERLQAELDAARLRYSSPPGDR